MVNLPPGALTALLILGPLVFILFRIIIKKSFSKNLPLPPGPYPWPIVGNIFQIGTNPHISLAKMAQLHGPLMSVRVGQRTLIIGSSSTAASEILKTHDQHLAGRDISRLLRYRTPTVHNKNLLFTSKCDDGWRTLRNLYGSELFSVRALESRTTMREDKVMEMVKYIASKEGEDMTIKDVMFVTTTNIMSNTALSIDLVDFEGNGIGEGIMESLRKITDLVSKPQLVDMFPILGEWDVQGWYKQIMHVVEGELAAIWKDSIERKRNETNSSNLKDFTDILIRKGFDNQQINALMQEIFAAGTETTTLSFEWFLTELLRNQDVLQKAREEIMKHIRGNVVKDSDLVNLPYLEACLKETLRLHPPIPLLAPRKAMQTCEVMGYTIPKDAQIMVNVWAISRDPEYWDDPLNFKPERFMGSKLSYKGKDFEFLPFGSGRRMCPGESMASEAILLTVASLILNFDWFLSNNMNPSDLNMDQVFGTVLHKKEPLCVTFKLREELIS